MKCKHPQGIRFRTNLTSFKTKTSSGAKGYSSGSGCIQSLAGFKTLSTRYSGLVYHFACPFILFILWFKSPELNGEELDFHP